MTFDVRARRVSLRLAPAALPRQAEAVTDAPDGFAGSASYHHTCSWAAEAPGEQANFDAETMALLRRISDLVPDTRKWLM